MRVWTTTLDEFEHVRALMMSAIDFGGRRAKLQLRSGQVLAGVIVSTNFGTDLLHGQTELQEVEAGQSTSKMFGELHVLPDVGRVMVLQATEIESIEPA